MKTTMIDFLEKKKDSKTISEIREQKEFSFCKPVEEEEGYTRIKVKEKLLVHQHIIGLESNRQCS